MARSGDFAALPLVVKNVCKSYHQKQVLKDIQLELRSGEIFGLIGLNGAGKTTLIKIMLDLTSADQGTVSWFGVDSQQVTSRRHLSYLPEKFQPSRYLKGREYVELTLEYYKKTASREQMEQMAVLLDLDPLVLGRRVGSYSKGMGQKLGLLAALLVDSPFLLLDEPMSGLDPRARIRLKDALLNARASGRTVFFSSHILSDLDDICDRIAVLHEGKMGYVGTAAEFKARYPGKSLEQAFLASIEAA